MCNERTTSHIFAMLLHAVGPTIAQDLNLHLKVLISEYA